MVGLLNARYQASFPNIVTAVVLVSLEAGRARAVSECTPPTFLPSRVLSFQSFLFSQREIDRERGGGGGRKREKERDREREREGGKEGEGETEKERERQ